MTTNTEMMRDYPANEPSRAEVDDSRGVLLLEFGAPWCGICQAAQPAIEAALRQAADVQHRKVSDGSGLPLGRSFKVKLWPTLIALRDGREVARVVRPQDARAIIDLLATATRTNDVAR
jgi:thioredoxin 1